jgi:hypothetical protein
MFDWFVKLGVRGMGSMSSCIRGLGSPGFFLGNEFLFFVVGLYEEMFVVG